jgi:translation elongation factor EF-Tu-like GTPase
MGFLSNLFGKKELGQVQETSGIYTFIIEDIFTITKLGCIVVGVVKGADIHLGDEVYIIDTNGNRLNSKVMGMENPRFGKMNVAPVGRNVGILLSDIEAVQLSKGDILTNRKEN